MFVGALSINRGGGEIFHISDKIKLASGRFSVHFREVLKVYRIYSVYNYIYHVF